MVVGLARRWIRSIWRPRREDSFPSRPPLRRLKCCLHGSCTLPRATAILSFRFDAFGFIVMQISNISFRFWQPFSLN